MTTPCESHLYHHVTNKAMKGEANDRISNLPSQLLVRVLECMPLRDAARTSILSRRWKYNWAGLSQLVFDTEFFRNISSKLLEDPDLQCLPCINSEVLLLHKGPILKFVFCSPGFLSCGGDHFDRWMLFLSRNGVKELILVDSPHENYRLGSSFYSCSELTRLELKHYKFEPPSSFNGFQYLTSLSFSSVSIRTNVFEAVISSATLLEKLTLKHCPGVDTVNISASNLKYLQIDGVFKSFALINTTNLVKAHLSVVYKIQIKNHPVHKKSNLIEVFGSAPRIEKLVLAQNTFGIFAADGIPTKLPTELRHLKHLTLSHANISSPDELLCALCLIRSSPNLQTLEILRPYNYFFGVDTDMKLSEKTRFEGFTLDKLQKVRMLDIEGSSRELYLIKFLLASAPQLDSMFIRCHLDIDREREVIFSRVLMQYPRASPKAKIKYLEPVITR